MGSLVVAMAVAWPCSSSPGHEPPAQKTPSIQKSVEAWPLARGNPESTGHSPLALPGELAVLWETKTVDAIEASPVVAGNTIVVVDVMGNVTALDLDTGEKKWGHELETGFVGSAALRITDKADEPRLVFAGDVEGNLYAWSLADGSEIWKQTTDAEIDAAPSFFNALVLVTSQDGRLYAFDAASGTPRWQYESGDQIRCSPTIIDAQTLLGGCDAKLHRVDLETGQSAGEPVPLDGPTGSTPAAGKSVIVVPTMSGTVFGINRSDGTERWQYRDEDQDQEYRTDAAVGNELAVIASARKHVDAISLDTGTRKWRYTLRRQADASPVIGGDDVWIAASDGRLIRLGLDDGVERWVHEIRGGFAAPPAIIGPTTSARLIIADDEGVVRCFGEAPDEN